ncbi:MAG: phage holin family protein [Candidatus Gracilibacteria bacterium]|nr:phage holin family protein [Candidatus Peregrinibacteria bacterium]
MQLLIIWLVTTVAVMIGAYIVPGVTVASFGAALVAAVVLGIINLVVKPLVTLLTLPVNILTLGLFTLVINALMIWLAANLVDGFTIEGFWPAFFMALIVSILAGAMGSVAK